MSDVWSAELPLGYLERVYDLCIYVVIVALPSHRFVIPRLDLWMTAAEGSRPVLIRRLSGPVRYSSASDAEGEGRYVLDTDR